MKKITFIGLGVMGYPMAGHLSKNTAYKVCVYNRTIQKAKQWVNEYNGHYEASLIRAVKEADIVFSCVGNDEDLKAITIGKQGAFSTMKKQAIWVDHSTVSCKLSTELSTASDAQGFTYLDAPISGGQVGAEKGQLTVMVGGKKEAYQQVKPLIQAFAKSVTLMGASGSGQLTKMVNQICFAGIIQSLSEGIRFAENAGLDTTKVFKVISQGAAQSWQMDNRHQSMIDNHFNHGFAVDWMRKDLSICFEEAKRNGSELPIAQIIDQYYAEIQKNGGNRDDTSSLITRLPKRK